MRSILPSFSSRIGAVLPVFAAGFITLCAQDASAQGEIRRLYTPGTDLGRSVAAAGDIDGDGYDDVAASNNTKTRIFSGWDGSVLREYPKGNVLDLGDCDGDGFSDLCMASIPVSTITLYSGATGGVLWNVASSANILVRAGDFNTDGRIDLLARDGSSVIIRSGADGTPLKSFPLVVNSLGGGQDIDGDGLPDFIVGRTTPNPDVAEVISSATGSVLWSIPSSTAGSNAVPAVALLSDVDDDAVPDFVVGEYSWTSSIGRVRLFSGKTATQVWQTAGNYALGGFGRTLITFPDINFDGRMDVLVSANRDAGIGGAKSSVTALSGRTGATIFKTFSTDIDDEYGYGLAAAGDVNGDDRPDFVVGEPLGSWQSINTGIAWIYTTYCKSQYSDLPGCTGAGMVKPTLGISGCMAAMCTSSINLTSAKGGVPGVLLVAPSTANISFTGNCVPSFNAASTLQIPFMTWGPPVSGFGSFSLAVAMPPNLGTAQFLLRAITLDSASPSGLVISNGVLTN